MLLASRSAEVTNGNTREQPVVSANSLHSATMAISASAPSAERVSSGVMCSASRITRLCEAAGTGGPPTRASTTSRWTVLDPTSSTPSRMGQR